MPPSPHANSTAASAPLHLGIILFSLAMGGFAIGTTEFASMSLLPFFATDLHIDEPTAGHAISAYALGVVLGAPLIAVLGARFARRTQLLVLMAIFAIGNALTALAPGYGWMIAARFLSGLPHGAYFGIAALVAASLVPTDKRSQAVGRLMLGLTCATIVGVPLANLVGQALGWRASFGLVSLLALLTMLLCALFAPRDRAGRSDPLRELAALRSGRVWITLAIGAIGFGGMFAVYTYLATTLIEVTKVSTTVIPFFLAVFGIGATLGNLYVPRFADRALMPTAGGILLFSAGALAVFPLAAGNPWLLAADVFAIGVQHRQCARPFPGRPCHPRGAGLDVDRSRRRRAGAVGIPDLDRRRSRPGLRSRRGELGKREPGKLRCPTGEHSGETGATVTQGGQLGKPGAGH